ncbi:MAG: hypothetical protein HYY55_03545 [Candidatus Niyogibacteria bacterium]|nr:MAG: hypothetical protein HYY55_03545 [Candidatus Niyogibacteria bacterium]
MRFAPKKITLLIAGMVFTAGLAASFVVPAFAGDPVGGLDITIEQIPGGLVSTKNYSSSLSNKSAGLIRMEVGDVLLRYGVGGADINKVTDALEGKGVYEAELKSFLIAIGVNEKGVQEVIAKLDELGAASNAAPAASNAVETGADSTEKESAGDGNAHGFPDRRADSPKKEFTSGAVFAPAARETPQPATVNPELHRPPTSLKELDTSENAKVLRDNFRENVRTLFKDDGTPLRRIAVAHGKGLRMLNRFRSAMARFDHILGRLESRIEKMRIEIEAEERAATGNTKSKFPPENDASLIERAKNMQVENEAKMEELKAKYESLLLGENAGGIAKEARAIAAELKADIENLRAIIIEIYTFADDYNSSRSNTSI